LTWLHGNGCGIGISCSISFCPD